MNITMWGTLSPESIANDSDHRLPTTWINANPTEDTLLHREDVRITLIIVYTIVFCCCFFGNLLVIVVVVVHRRMRTITNFFLTNLAIADLCVGLFCVYQGLFNYLNDDWPFGNFLCKMYHFMQSLSYTTSVGILTVICVERYIAIVHPMWSKQALTLRRLRIIIMLVWCLSATFCFPRLFISGTTQVPSAIDPNHMSTICIMKRITYNPRLFDALNFFVCFMTPIGVMSVMYCIIGVRLWKSSVPLANNRTAKALLRNDGVELNVHSHTTSKRYHKCKMCCCQKSSTPSQASDDSIIARVPSDFPTETSCVVQRSPDISVSKPKKTKKNTCNNASLVNHLHYHYQYQAARTVLKARRKVIRLLIAVVLCFAICNLPFHARKFWQNYSSSYRGDSPNAVILTIVTTLMVYLNSFINPILYAFLSDNFRRSMRDVLLCRTRKRLRRQHSTTVNGRTTSTVLQPEHIHGVNATL